MTDQSISRAIDEAARRLSAAGVADPRREAASLLGFVLDRDRTYLITNPDRLLIPDETERMNAAVERRGRREPFQHISGRQEFYGLNYQVSPEVLIPRPETELLVEAALDLIRPDGMKQSICDVGTGSGCIIVTLLHERAQLHGLGLDISPTAIEVARTNAAALGVAERLDLRISDCFSALLPGREVFSLITANPPYITEADYPNIQPEVRDHEPRSALTPGGDGLSVVRRIIADAPNFLLADGHLLMEIGYDQADAVADLIDRKNWSKFEILPDLQGIPRCVVLRRS